jgi:SAM-dependent methyltransferase
VADTWEAVAHEWVAHVRSGGDATYEWNARAFFDLMPPPSGLTIDVGCGEGRTTRELDARGYSVVGADLAPTLVRLAREADPFGEYVVADAADLPFDDGVGAVVVAFMVLQDLENLDAAVAEAARVLDNGGAFCFAIVHPVATAGDFLGSDDDTFAIGRYCTRFEVTRPLGRQSVLQFHRPLDDYSRALERSGFCIEAVREIPTRHRAAGSVPAFLHVRTAKSG